MSSKVKSLLIGGILVLVLVAVLIVLKFTAPTEDDSSSSEDSSTTESETFVLIEETADNCESIVISNETGEYTISKLGEEKWGNTNLQDYTELSDTYASAVSSLSALTSSQKVLDSVDDLATYGLEKPSAVATLKYGDKQYTIKIGDALPTNTNRYAMIDSDPALYTVSNNVAKILLRGELEYISKTLVSAYDTSDATATPVITEFILDRKDLDYQIVLEKAPELSEDMKALVAYTSSLVMTAPISTDVSTTCETEMILTLFGATASDVAAIDAANKMEEYGFNDPSAVIQMTYDSRKVTITIGDDVPDTDGKYCYLLFNNNNVVYTIAKSSIAAIDYDPDKMISRLVVLPYIDSVGTINLHINDKDYQFTLEGEGDDLIPTVAGQTVNTSNFKLFYQLLLSVSVEKINFKQPEGDPVMVIEYVFRDQNLDVKSEKVEIYEDENRRMVIALNGNAYFEGRIAYLDKVQTEINNLIEGNTVDVDW